MQNATIKLIEGVLETGIIGESTLVELIEDLAVLALDGVRPVEVMYAYLERDIFPNRFAELKEKYRDKLAPRRIVMGDESTGAFEVEYCPICSSMVVETLSGQIECPRHGVVGMRGENREQDR